MSEELKPVTAERNLNQGHGHVFRRPDGVRMRCGGPGICAECAKDLVQLQAAWNTRTPPRVKALEWVSCRRNENDPSVAHTRHTYFAGLVEVGEVLDYDEGDIWVDDGMGDYCEFKDADAPDILAAAKASVARRVLACLEGYDD